MSISRVGRGLIRLAIALLMLSAEVAAAGGDAAPADALAQAIREARSVEDPAQRAEGLRAAAAAAAALSGRLDAGSTLWRRVQSDRLYALQLAGENAAAAVVYDLLRAAGAELPEYAREAAAEALFAVGRSDDAERVLRLSLAASPQQPRPLIQLARGLEAAGRGDEAYRHTVDWWQRYGDRTDLPDIDRLEGGLLAARLARWQQRPALAQAQLDALGPEFAGHRLLLAEQAALHRDQARPRAALATLAGRDDERSRLLAAQAWLDLGQPQRALARASSSAELRGRAEAQSGSRGGLALGYANTRSPALQSPSGAEETTLRLAADSARLRQHWRLGLRAAQLRAEFQGARPESRHAGARLTRHVSGGEWALEAGAAFDDFLDQAYLLLEGSTWLADHWRLGLRAAYQDPEGPLQARASRIGVDSLALSGTWRPSPVWRVDLGLGRSWFDDSNRRHFLSLGAEARLHAAAGRSTHGFISAYAGSNRLDEAAYFNPGHSASLETGIVHRLGPRLGIAHQLRPVLAYVHQEGFGAHLVPLFAYRLGWPQAGGEPYAEFTAAQPVYDGQRETRLAAAIGYRWGAR